MSDLAYDDRRTRQTKQHLLTAGLLAPRTVERAVPDVIQRSWRRCIGLSAPSARASVRYLDAADRNAQLVDAAAPIFDRIGAHLAGMGVALFLSDSKGQIVLRRVNDRRQRDVYDNASAAEGFDFSEISIGTNGLGTVLEEQKPVFVRGSEHFNEALEPLACAGVPIFKPYTRQVVGSFALACRSDAANALMYGVALDIGRQIETHIASMQGDRERALAQAYLTANQSRRDPVIVVSEHSALANTVGLRYLSNESHALLWDYLAGAPSGPDSDAPVRTSVPIDGGHSDAIVQRVDGVGDDATYLLHLLPAPRDPSPPGALGAAGRRARRAAIATAVAADRPLHPVDAVDAQLASAARSGACLAVAGAGGTGKYTAAEKLLRRLQHGAHPVVIDLSVASRGSSAWYRQAAKARDSGRGVILLHLQDLPARQVNLVKAIAQTTARARSGSGSSGSGSRSEATGPGASSVVLTVNLADSPPHVESLVRRLATTVELPPLRAMADRIPELVRQVLGEMPLGERPSGFSTGALQALMRWDWPGNLAELHRTVEQLAWHLPGCSVEVGDLPPHFQTAAHQRSLSAMQSAERAAIIAALHGAAGNRTEAAATLGIGRTTLYRKLRAYRIEA